MEDDRCCEEVSMATPLELQLQSIGATPQPHMPLDRLCCSFAYTTPTCRRVLPDVPQHTVHQRHAAAPQDP